MATAGVFDYTRGKLASFELDYRLAGRFGAFLHGVPVDVTSLDLAITPDGAETFAAWLGRFPGVHRWNEKLQEYWGNNRDPRTGGAARWRSPGGDFGAVLLDALPPPVTIRLGDVDYPVLPFSAIVASDPTIARIVERVAALRET